jgi:hypothetical protein
VLDYVIATWFGVLDRLAPPTETPVDRAIREKGERLRNAFPCLDARGENEIATDASVKRRCRDRWFGWKK